MPPIKEEHIKIGLDRHVSVPEALRAVSVQYDHNIETVTFDCPRFWDGHDMSKMTVYINYMRQDRHRDKDLAENVTVDQSDENIMHFTWTLSRNATLCKGELKFLACVVDVDDQGFEKHHWNSKLCENQLYINEGLECDNAVKELHADIITDLLLRMDKILVATTPILDTTLTERGLAADAKATGDMIDEINQDLATSTLSLAADIRNKSDALSKAISAETASRKAEIDVERKRINKFVSLKAGSTTGDAELMDARVGANGVTYDTLGDAVRSQFQTIANSSTRLYRFDIGGIANTLGTVSANRTRIRTVLPYLEPEFTITNFTLPENIQKATILGLKNDAFVADLYSCLTVGDDSISFVLNTDVDIDAIGISFQHSDGSEFTIDEAQTSFLEYRTSYKDIDKFARASSNGTMMTGKLKRGVVGTDGGFTVNGVALSTDFIECRGDEFTLLGMAEYLFLRCVGRDFLGNYSTLDVYPEEGGYRVHTTNIEAVAFSFYKGIVDGSHVAITDDEYEAASFWYTASFDDINAYVSGIADELRSSISEVEQKVTSVSGSTFVSLGDSITYGFIPRNSPGYPGQLDSYAALTAEYYNMNFVNHGISGSTVAYVEGRSPMCERVADLPDDADIVTFMGGTNDIRNGVSLGTMSDRTRDTFYGALHIIMSTLYEKYVVNRFGNDGERAKIIICTPIKLLDASSAKQNDSEGVLVNLEPWVEAIKEVARYYSFPVLDFYNLSGINPHLNRVVKGTDADYNGYYNPYVTDGTHPNQEGARLMSEILISFIKTI